jgi:hypothetical protein
MLFRINTGQIIEINKYDYANDYLYYKKVLELKKYIPKHNSEKTFNNENNKQTNK